MNASDIIDHLGGPTAVAKLCECAPQAVSQWRHSGIPKPRLMYLRVIRPDVFEKVGAGETAPAAEAAHA